MKINYALSLFFISNLVFATNMNEAFSQGRSVGNTYNSDGQKLMKGFQPNQFEGYQSTPQVGQYYTGVTGNNPDLNSKGMNELNSSESGKAIKDSIINNPKVKISENSDFIQASNNIRKNADIISGINTSKNCVAKVLSKTSFSNHYCEKDNKIEESCSIKQNVKWVKKKEKLFDEMEFLSKYSSFKPRTSYYGSNSFYIPAVKTGKLKGVEIIVKNHNTKHRLVINDEELIGRKSFWGVRKKRTINNKYCVVNCNPNNIVNTKFYIPMNNKYVEQGKGAVKVTSEMTYTYNHHTLWEHMNFDIVFIYNEVEGQYIDVEEPEIVTESLCNTDINNAIKLNDFCSEKGIKIFERNGKTYTLNSDCWNRNITYLINDANDNECGNYENNDNCTVSERECISNIGSYCTRFRVRYQCSKTVSTEGFVCGDKFFCSDGSCSDLEGSVNADFGHAVSQLASLAQATNDIELDAQKMRAFTGKSMQCRKSGFGFSNCCKDSGWGHKAGLAKCNSEENSLGQAKEKKLAVYVGTYCSKKVLKKCIQRKSTYCVFDNKLARIIQYQGRSGQLGVDFGSAESPNCRGVTIEELQQLDFNAMDYSDFYDELNEKTNLPDKQQLIEHMRNSIINQLQNQ